MVRSITDQCNMSLGKLWDSEGQEAQCAAVRGGHESGHDLMDGQQQPWINKHGISRQWNSSQTAERSEIY